LGDNFTSVVTSIDGGLIQTGKVLAGFIEADELEVQAAKIQGLLTATQIDATSLTVEAANITGQLTAGQIDTSGITISAATSIDTTDVDGYQASGERVEITNEVIKVYSSTSTSSTTGLRVKLGNLQA
jgi:hypothetical protein